MRELFTNPHKRKYFFAFLMFLWLALLSGSFLKTTLTLDENAYTLALHDARTNFQKDVTYRKWAAKEGGLYVPVSKYTLPNPYLKVPNRDVETKDGQKLTLVNPAYMTRMVHEIENANYPVKGHITSLTPLNPSNKPDAWEAKALASLTKKQSEYHSIEVINKKEFFRYIGVLIVDENCLKCHAQQGYKLGDVRGGISVAIPYESYASFTTAHKNSDLIFHLIIGVIGLAGLFLYAKTSAKQRKEVEVEHEKYKTILELSPEAILVHTNGKFVYANKSAKHIFHATNERDFIGKEVSSFVHPESIKGVSDRIKKIIQDKASVSPAVEKIICFDGTVTEMEVSAAPILYENKPSVILVARDVSDLQKAYREIHTTKEKLQALIDAFPDLIFTVDREGVFLETHFREIDSLLLSPEQFLGKTFSETLPKKIADEALEHLKILFATGEPQAHNYSLQMAGTERYFDARISLKGNDEALAVVRDITKLKTQELELQKLSHTVVQNPISIVITDQNGNIEYVNPKFTEVTGYTLEEAKCQTPRILKSGMQDQAFYEKLWNTILSGQTWKGEFENKKKNGELYWERAVISSIKNEEGSIIKFFALKEDITELKNTTDALQRNEQKLNFYLNNSPLATVEWDAKFAITRWAGEAEKIFGYTKEEMLGKQFTDKDLVYHEDASLVELVKEKMIYSNSIYEVSTNRNVTKSGSVIICTWYSSVLRDDEGKILSVLALVQDITQQKNAEQKLVNQLNEIERFNKLMIGRENKMIELKTEINALLEECGKSKKYNSHLS